MNIFELYLDKIKSILIDLDKQGKLFIPEHSMVLMQKYHLLNSIAIYQQTLRWFFQS